MWICEPNRNEWCHAHLDAQMDNGNLREWIIKFLLQTHSEHRRDGRSNRRSILDRIEKR